MKIPQVKDSQVEKLRTVSTIIYHGSYSVQDPVWIEGVDLVGYWKTGDSFIFSHGKYHVCISKSFLKTLLKQYEKH